MTDLTSGLRFAAQPVVSVFVPGRPPGHTTPPSIVSASVP